jgi:hypothetical protein
MPSVYEYSTAKCKGRFEFADLALHKNKSHLVISKAIFYYFVHGIDPRAFLHAQTNIFDFCAGKKIRGDWSFIKESIENGDHKREPLQNTIRYYMSNSGCKIMKENFTDGRATQTEAGKYMQTLFIDYVEKEIEDYDLNYDYYLEKIMKEIYNLEPNVNQLSLF